MKNWDVFVYGDINIDLILPGVETVPPGGEEWEVPQMETQPGGGSALFALGLARLGMRPVFQGKVGEDFYGRFLRDYMEQEGVDTQLLVTEKGRKTGISISFTNEKDRSFLTFRGPDFSQEENQKGMEEYAGKARHVHVTGYEGRKHEQYLDMLSMLKKKSDVTISMDVGWDGSGMWDQRIRQLFPYLDILLMNETECLHYGQEKTAKENALDFSRQGCMAVIKLGKQGAIAAKDGRLYERQGFSVKALDTTGAGDSFNAGFVYGFLQGYSVERSLECGNGCGALSCTALGGNAGFPDEKTLKAFIRGEK